MLAGVVSMVVMGVLEIVRKYDLGVHGAIEQNVAGVHYNASRVRLYWQTPQFLLVGVAESFTLVSGNFISNRRCRETFLRFFVHRVTHNRHTHPFNGPLSGTTRVSRYQKSKTNLDFTEARDSEWQWHHLGRVQVCTSLHTDNHARTPPLSFFPHDAMHPRY